MKNWLPRCPPAASRPSPSRPLRACTCRLRRRVDVGVAGAAVSRTGRVAALDHEPGNDPVEDRVVEEAALHEVDERRGGVRRLLLVDPEGEAPAVRRPSDVVDLCRPRALRRPRLLVGGERGRRGDDDAAVLLRRGRGRRAARALLAAAARGSEDEQEGACEHERGRDASSSFDASEGAGHQGTGDLDLVAHCREAASRPSREPSSSQGTGATPASATVVVAPRRTAATPTSGKPKRLRSIAFRYTEASHGVDASSSSNLARLERDEPDVPGIGKPVEAGQRQLAAVRPDGRAERQQRGREIGRMRRGAEVVGEDRVLPVLAVAGVAAVAAVQPAGVLRAASTSNGSTGAGCRRSCPCSGAAARRRAGRPPAARREAPRSPRAPRASSRRRSRPPETPRGSSPARSTSVSASSRPSCELRHDFRSAREQHGAGPDFDLLDALRPDDPKRSRPSPGHHLARPRVPSGEPRRGPRASPRG